MADTASLITRLLALHKQGSLHPADGGQICVGCGGQWPCRTVGIINDYAVEALG